MHSPSSADPAMPVVVVVQTRNRKPLRESAIARSELRVDKYRVFYQLDDESQSVTVVDIGHKDHEVLLIRGKRVQA
jgi:mRNA-degrading endonuclease RelE of RelBE toxin-antitoxin system